MNDELLFATLIELADTTTTGFDLVSMSNLLVEASVKVLGVAAAGIMLADQRKSLRVFASSDEETRILELLELQNNDGPCLEAFHSGAPIDGVDLSTHTARWPHFAPAAMAAGFDSAYAVPMRLREQTIGALNLFQTGIEPFSAHKVNVARVLADMAAIGIINHWSLRQEEVLAQQLQSALNTRVIIEQAKGVVAERRGLSMSEAFEYLRSTARASRRPIAEVAIETVNGPDVSSDPSVPSTPVEGAVPDPNPSMLEVVAQLEAAPLPEEAVLRTKRSRQDPR
jgi:GAF domain-containing protein